MRLIFLATLLLAAPAPAGDLESLLEEAASDHWRVRWAAVVRMARLPDADARTLPPLMLRERRARVREAVAWACLLEPRLANATLLGLVVRRDKAPAVRRAAARALVHFPDRRAVAALVEALGRETDERTRLQMIETLRALTPAPCLLEAGAWRDWWAKNEQDPRFRPADEAPRKGEYEGVVLETRTLEPVRPGGKSRRPPPHVLVLPGFGWTAEVYGPYLLPLRGSAALTWVRLPGVQTLTGRSGYGSDVATYPVDRLVKALDRFRASLSIDRFVVCASGASGWIAMRYAQRLPERCAGLILIDTALDKQAYAACLRRGAARGDRDEKFTARTLLRENSVPFHAGTLDRLHAIGLERGYHDSADLEIGHLFARGRDPQGFAIVPEIAWGKRARLDVPALFLYSGASVFSGHHEAGRIQRHFPRSLVAPLSGIRAMPYVEANRKFHEIVRAFLERFDLVD